MNELLTSLKQGLIVSCQALQDEPLHSSFIMGRMAVAAELGGAVGIRANTAEDIKEIKSQVDLPVIGIVKRNYGECPVFITPTMKEIDELVKVGSEIIALDATLRERPDGKHLGEVVAEIRSKYPDQLLMADVSNLEEGLNAERLGFDMVSTTLIGYTDYTQGHQVYADDFALVKEFVSKLTVPVIAEGNILTPEAARRCLEIGVHAVVVGGAITRPQLITQRFVNEIGKVSTSV
ncbi:N-acetylmannosamine-6-phosphate 2-epimerase [Paenibacillus sp. J22TS3]|uniref:N-acetylmannosamine-6-phosphate 2-epimerase n=1 Tax=Paenibacillus sp. J22TS3 TaxID=2807192 RepID=UPI001B2BD737|nr:N-acetylmannosamine-6-phosphate 2-epimerase [Paenibacillus sp. J22TS3]GIP24461.1 putative N-acetylmannosamine-6-phosphate 2-epimerase [Paenibacillus sp. J22TS3]